MILMYTDMIHFCIMLILFEISYLSNSWSVINYKYYLSKRHLSMNLSPSLHPNIVSDSSITQSSTIIFDADFAESISKPLPQWFIESNLEREKLMKEIIKNRERIIQEFKLKYELSELEKQKEKEEKLLRIKQRLLEKKLKKSKFNTMNWLQQIYYQINSIVAGTVGGVTTSVEADESDDASLIEQTRAEIEAEEILSTKENWENFWENEQKETGFYLPNFFDVFPELKLKWPTWSKRRDGTAIECETDLDCPFPQACCPHPIIPGQKFCCTGFGNRIMVPAYARQQISSNDIGNSNDNQDNQSSKGGNDRDNWRPSPDLSESPF